ncbi:MAG: hypothetical protein C4297_04060 [Gemmataceae bacterium]
MTEFIPLAQVRGDASLATARLRLEIRRPDAAPEQFDCATDVVILGSVPGCDVRLPASEVPPLLGVLTLTAQGLFWRKLAPACALLRNGQPFSHGPLANGDKLRAGTCEITVRFLEDGPHPEQVLQQKLRDLDEARRLFEEEKREWELDAEKQAEALAFRSRKLQEQETALARQEQQLAEAHKALAQREQDLQHMLSQLTTLQNEVAQKAQQIERAAQQLAEIRRRLHETYLRKRDHLLALCQTVEAAIAKARHFKRQHMSQDTSSASAERDQLADRSSHVLSHTAVSDPAAASGSSPNAHDLLSTPVTLLDLLKITAHERIFRGFDPKRNLQVLVRQPTGGPNASRTEEYVVAFRKTAAIVHPRLLRTLDVIQLPATVLVVQEWPEGLPLSDLPDQLMSVPVICHLTHQTLEALHALHTTGLAHGRLRPARLLLSADGTLKLCGWGEPWWLSPDAAFTPTAGPPDFDHLRRQDLVQTGQLLRHWLTRLSDERRDPRYPILWQIAERLLASDSHTSFASTADALREVEAIPSEAGDHNCLDSFVAALRPLLAA